MLDCWIGGLMDFWMIVEGRRFSSYPAIQLSSYPAIQPSSYPAIQSSSNLLFHLFLSCQAETASVVLAAMKIKQVSFFIAVTVLFTLTAFAEEFSYEESTRGNYTYLNPFAHKPESPAAHWDYATSLREQGKLRSARKQFEILVKRWPESVQAAGAMQAVGDLSVELGDDAEAFEAYEKLIASYYTGLKNYDSVLENQYAIARRVMERKRMRLLFGGYTAPERAIPYLESILRNAPQWERAPEMQYQIGQAYQQDDKLNEAVAAYSVVEFRYPGSPFAERAGLARIECLKQLVEETPYSADLREEALLVTEVFAATYPQSESLPEVARFAEELADQEAAHDLEVARFYERVEEPARHEAARIYYESVTNEFSGTAPAEVAGERLSVLIPLGADGVDGSWVFGKEGGRIERGSLPERTSDDPMALEVTADQLSYESNLLVGEGDVAIQKEDMSLQADYVSVDRESGEIIARGDVLLLRGADRWEGQRLAYNFKTEQGEFGPLSMYFDPVYVVAQETERVSSNEYRMVNVRITTCSGDEPSIYAKAKEVTLIDGDGEDERVIQARKVTFYVADVPVFYVPFWQRNLKDHVFSFTAGYGGHLGAFIMSTANYHPTDWLLARTHLDYYSKRGVGLGQDFIWTTPNGRGSIKGYHIFDQEPYEDDDLNADEIGLIDESRYRIHVDHHEQFTDETYFQTEINYLSDPLLLDDFFEDEYRRNVNVENFAVVQHSTDELAAGVRVDKRLNDFYQTVDRMPEGSFNLYRRAIGEYLYFQSDNRAGYYQMLFEDYDSSLPDDYSSVRVDSYNQLFMPIRIDDFFNVIPRAAYRGTWYSDSPSGDAQYRNLFEGGMLTSFKAHRELTAKSGFYGTGLRHVVEPYVDYLYRYSGMETNELYQFDDVDGLEDRNEVRFGVRNFLQTKRGDKRTENVVDADLYTAYRIERDNFALLGADVELSLTDDLSLQSDLRYDLHGGDVERWNARASYDASDSSRFWTEYRYLTQTRSLLTVGSDLFPNNDWFYQFLVRYDAEHNEWRERRLLVNHRFDCIGVGLGLKVDEDNVPSLWMTLWLNAFGPNRDFERL